jgi:hypothetical protein
MPPELDLERRSALQPAGKPHWDSASRYDIGGEIVELDTGVRCRAASTGSVPSDRQDRSNSRQLATIP